jgi:glycosyltransferase involved in cell wall biosynthesis
MPSISYAITACNEHVELDRLLSQLLSSIRDEDEIIVQMDASPHDKYHLPEDKKKVLWYIMNLQEQGRIRVAFCPLNNDFATFKNNLKSLCTKDYIFQIDADEYLSEELLTYLPAILEDNSNVEMFSIPRINTVEDLTEQHIKQWGWRVDERGWVNYPDYQNRILKNNPEIHWVNKVHEKIVGAMTTTSLPPGFDLIHPKDIKRQEKQNAFYDQI